MSEVSLEIKLGSISSICGTLSFTLRIDQNQKGKLYLYAYDPSDLRKSGILLNLDANGYSDLKKNIENIDLTIDKLQTSNQLTDLSVNR